VVGLLAPGPLQGPSAPEQRPSGAFHGRPRISSAARTRDWYARRKEGKRVYRLELEAAAVEDLLTHAGLLALVDGDDHAKIEAALGRLIAIMIEDDRRG
jgi:hypothetical protein